VRRLESNYLIFRMGWPGIESEKILRVIEMMGNRVLPASTPNTGAADQPRRCAGKRRDVGLTGKQPVASGRLNSGNKDGRREAAVASLE
jgi:hypothetical protein